MYSFIFFFYFIVQPIVRETFTTCINSECMCVGWGLTINMFFTNFGGVCVAFISVVFIMFVKACHRSLQLSLKSIQESVIKFTGRARFWLGVSFCMPISNLQCCLVSCSVWLKYCCVFRKPTTHFYTVFKLALFPIYCWNIELICTFVVIKISPTRFFSYSKQFSLL